MGQLQRLVLKKPTPDPGAVMGLQGVDGFQPQLGAALAVEMGAELQTGEASGSLEWKWTESPSGSLFWMR